MTRLSERTIVSLADIREHWIKAAAYDVVCARRADDLLRRDALVMNAVLVLTTISSLGVFTALVGDDPATWAEATVFAVTASAAVLTAVRQQNDWGRASGALREKGVGWNRQRTSAGDLAQHVISGRPVSDAQRADVNENEARLLAGHPPIPSETYVRVKALKAVEFDSAYQFR